MGQCRAPWFGTNAAPLQLAGVCSRLPGWQTFRVSNQPLPEHRGPEAAQARDYRETIALVERLLGQ